MLKVVHDKGMVTIKTTNWGLQLYYPIVTLKDNIFILSFTNVLAITGKTWQFDYSMGFQVFGFGFGFGKYKETKYA